MEENCTVGRTVGGGVTAVDGEGGAESDDFAVAVAAGSGEGVKSGADGVSGAEYGNGDGWGSGVGFGIGEEVGMADGIRDGVRCPSETGDRGVCSVQKESSDGRRDAVLALRKTSTDEESREPQFVLTGIRLVSWL